MRVVPSLAVVVLLALVLVGGVPGSVAAQDAEVGASARCTDEDDNSRASDFEGQAGFKVDTAEDDLGASSVEASDVRAHTAYLLFVWGLAHQQSDPCDGDNDPEYRDEYMEAHAQAGDHSAQFCYAEGYNGFADYAIPEVASPSHHDEANHHCTWEDDGNHST